MGFWTAGTGPIKWVDVMQPPVRSPVRGAVAAAVFFANMVASGGAVGAEEPAGRARAAFGAPGQLVLSTDLRFDVVHTSTTQRSRTDISIQPSADYFIMPHLSVGALLGYTSSPAAFGPLSTNTSFTQVAIMARIGYDLPLTELLSIWARAGLGYAHDTFSVPGIGDTSGYTLPFTLFVPLLFHPAPHFFLGIGPELGYELASTVANVGNATTFGFQSIVGGSFGTK
jgi:hypothetical protein